MSSECNYLDVDLDLTNLMNNINTDFDSTEFAGGESREIVQSVQE